MIQTGRKTHLKNTSQISKQSWLQVLIILSLNFSAFYCSNLYAQDFDISVGDNIRVISDKAYRRSQENLFEAVGNVIITHGTNAIYGEKATLNFETGETDVIGNVRYVGPDMTMYGSELHYNLETELLRVQNARIVSDNYVVLGSEIWREEEGEIRALDAEYTTCRDCPESWSVVGGEVRITLDEYIRIKNAYIKVRGVVVMYVPYIILPIKKDRETGLLFPNFSMRFEEGMRFQQPFFWAISDHKDMTLTPSFFGKRGYGGEFQYRQALGERRWFEVNSLLASDRIYDPEMPGTDQQTNHTFRHFSEYEHSYQFSNNFTHHLYFNDMRDLDMVRDYDFLVQNRQRGSEIGGGGFFDWRRDNFNISVESHFNNSQIADDPMDFDDDYVQILPRVGFNLMPQTIIQSDIPGLRRWSFDFSGDYTIFKQNNANEQEYLRNAHRVNMLPRVDVDLGHIGPVNFSTQSRLDYQYYHFPTEEEERYFSKMAHIQESEATFELEKVFGLAYREELQRDQVDWDSGSDPLGTDYLSSPEIIGQIPRFQRDIQQDRVVVTRNSYRHSQQFRIRHLYLAYEKSAGSERFGRQILDDRGQFDSNDALRRSQHLSNTASRTALPLANTVELQWNNSLIKKSARSFDYYQDNRYLRDNFSYSRMAYFNVSQGYDMDSDGEALRERMTRLHIDTGFNIGRTSFRAQEYYLFDSQDHLFSISVDQRFNRSRLGVSLIYDSFNRPSDKRFSVEGALSLSEYFDVRGHYDYDLEDGREVLSEYGVTYSPSNNCWKLDISYGRSMVEKRASVNFLINFNDNSFQGFSGD